MKTGVLDFFKMILSFMILPILWMGPGMCFDCRSRTPFGQRVPDETAGTGVHELAATGDRRYVCFDFQTLVAGVALGRKVNSLLPFACRA